MVLYTSILKGKADLRRGLIDSRRSLGADERKRRSHRICEACRHLPALVESPLISSYVGFGEEVETADLIRLLLSEGRRICVPVHGASSAEPAFAEITSWEDLAPNSLGYLEPPPERLRLSPTDAIGCFLVPGLGFDIRGNRLGYGLGFYDRALQSASPDSLLVGLAFDLQVLEIVPVSRHDVPMQLIITETREIDPSLHRDQ
jgi:5-formyltetrahydrofolate cyclo-ligase